MNAIFAAMKYTVFLILIVLHSCGLGSRMERLDSGRQQADAFLQHLGDSVWAASLPTEAQVFGRNLGNSIGSRCDWPRRRGKFVDFYMHREGNRQAVTYIYEFFLDCDSVRVLLTYNTASDSVRMESAFIEPIETENPWLVDPMKSIHKDKDWEKRKAN